MRTLDAATLNSYTNMNSRRSLAKEPGDAACWNWALYGLKGGTVAHPSVLFGYVSRAADANRHTEEATLDANAGRVWDNLQLHQPLRTELNQIRTDYDAIPDDVATRNNIRDRVFDLRAAGFTISAAPTSYCVCMFEPGDVVMFDHWWLEINGTVVETVTGNQHPLYAYSDVYLAPAFNHPRHRVAYKAATNGLSADSQQRVHSRYVTSLQDSQAH
jgi:hypothetical protein